jgi:hypothetical protein
MVRSEKRLVVVQLTYSSPIWVSQSMRRFRLGLRGVRRTEVALEGIGKGLEVAVVVVGCRGTVVVIKVGGAVVVGTSVGDGRGSTEVVGSGR